MTPIEILHAIVSTEQEARSKYQDALEEQRSFDDSVIEEKAKLKSEFYGRADDELAEFEKVEVHKANEEIDRLNAKLRRELDDARRSFELLGAGYIEQIYRNVTNNDV